jgi:hypothetical protein
MVSRGADDGQTGGADAAALIIGDRQFLQSMPQGAVPALRICSSKVSMPGVATTARATLRERTSAATAIRAMTPMSGLRLPVLTRRDRR